MAWVKNVLEYQDKVNSVETTLSKKAEGSRRQRDGVKSRPRPAKLQVSRVARGFG